VDEEAGDGGLGAVCHVQLHEEPRDMRPDGAMRDAQPPGDHRVVHALRQQGENLVLPVRDVPRAQTGCKRCAVGRGVNGGLSTEAMMAALLSRRYTSAEHNMTHHLPVTNSKSLNRPPITIEVAKVPHGRVGDGPAPHTGRVPQ
jgi:hypothetical protein